MSIYQSDTAPYCVSLPVSFVLNNNFVTQSVKQKQLHRNWFYTRKGMMSYFNKSTRTSQIPSDKSYMLLKTVTFYCLL